MTAVAGDFLSVWGQALHGPVICLAHWQACLAEKRSSRVHLLLPLFQITDKKPEAVVNHLSSESKKCVTEQVGAPVQDTFPASAAGRVSALEFIWILCFPTAVTSGWKALKDTFLQSNNDTFLPALGCSGRPNKIPQPGSL